MFANVTDVITTVSANSAVFAGVGSAAVCGQLWGGSAEGSCGVS